MAGRRPAQVSESQLAETQMAGLRQVVSGIPTATRPICYCRVVHMYGRI